MATITLDGRECELREGESIMAVARREGQPLASVCYSDRLEGYGSCRLCMVQVEGQRAFAAACTTPAREGMVVSTRTPDLDRIRRTLLELYSSEGGEGYLPGGGNGRGEVHTLAQEYSADSARFATNGHARRPAPVDDSSPYFTFDPTRCVLCARCVRACDEVQGQGVLHLEGRGFHTQVVAGAGTFAGSACVTCGACVAECPTDALTDRSVQKLWQERDMLVPRTGRSNTVASDLFTSVTRTTCTYCGVGCQFDAQVAEGRIVRMQPAADAPVNAGHACVKGRYAFDYVMAPDRLTQPLIREGDCLREASWEEAVALIASRFAALLAEHGPGAVACISSSRGTNEENYLMQKFVRAALGNNNIDNCARVCHSSTVAGMQEVLGTGAATNSLADIDAARLIMIVGCNPTEGHPVTGARIKRAARRGTPLIVIDPRRIELARYAAVHLQLRPGTNVAVLNGLAHVIIEEGLADEAFIRERTENYDTYRQTVATYTPERVQEISGVPADELRRAARLYATSGASMACHGLGVSEHRTGSYGVMCLANLAILTGNVGRPGTGINPLRGQNNVQGSCDVGALPNVLTAYQKPADPAVRSKFEAAWGRPLPQQAGLKIPEMWEAAIEGKLKGMWVMGYDAAHTEPNLPHVDKALGSLDFLVVSDLFMNETARFAHVVLPAAGALEKDGTFTNGERRVQRVRRAVDAPGEARPDWEAICAVSEAMGVPMPYTHPSEIMDEIAALTPTMSGISYARLDEAGLQWPVPQAAHPGTPILHTADFPRAQGLARFAPVEYLPPGEEPDAEYPFVLVTGRVLEHYNAGTMTRRTRLAAVVDRDYLEMHPADAHAMGLRDGEEVEVISRRHSARLTLRLSERSAPGILFTTFHFPEAGVNSLLSSSSDLLTRCPEYKVLTVRVSKEK